eukprot:scaffold12156_cov114-Isochrysis_galbana.AAC.1
MLIGGGRYCAAGVLVVRTCVCDVARGPGPRRRVSQQPHGAQRAAHLAHVWPAYLVSGPSGGSAIGSISGSSVHTCSQTRVVGVVSGQSFLGSGFALHLGGEMRDAARVDDE